MERSGWRVIEEEKWMERDRWRQTDGEMDEEKSMERG
jgi:hypothetical protein